MKRFQPTYTAVHIATGEWAMIFKSEDGLCFAQFNRQTHRHAYGWHVYTRKSFHVVRTVKEKW